MVKLLTSRPSRVGRFLNFSAVTFGLTLYLACGSPAQAQTCTGNCGSSSPNGSVTAPPSFGPDFSYVSTYQGVAGAGEISGVGGTNGSEYVTAAFAAASGDPLNFNFNYITSDGAGFSDYAFAQLLTSSMDPVAYLFTARTTTSGDTSPGFGLPANSSVLSPATTPIMSGSANTVFGPLGSSTGGCFDTGCGMTGWINSNYVIPTAGNYILRLGVTNVADQAFNSALAFAGVTVAGTVIDTPGGSAVPEPSTWALMMMGFGVIGTAVRRRKAGLSQVRLA